MLPSKLKPPGPVTDVEQLRAFLEEHAAGIAAEALRIPRTPENLALFIQAGNNLAALEILKGHLPE